MVDFSIILDLLSKSNISKVAGIDKLSGTFIKDGAESIAQPFYKDNKREARVPEPFN